MHKSILDEMRELLDAHEGLDEKSKHSIEMVFMTGVSSVVAMLSTSADPIGQLKAISDEVLTYMDGLNKLVVVTDEQDE